MSDDVCGSGNYTVQMSLRPAAEADPEAEGSAPSQETFLALLAVQSNGSQPVLQVRSCCVTPSASPGGPGATCCVFRRSGAELRRWARRHTGLWGWAGNGLIPGGRLQQPPALSARGHHSGPRMGDGLLHGPPFPHHHLMAILAKPVWVEHRETGGFIS